MSRPGYLRNALFAAAAVVGLTILAGARDLTRASYHGYWTDDDNNIVRVFAGSPAATAGLQVNDRIHSVGGVDVVDTKANARRARAAIGETRTYVVARAGERTQADLTYSPLPARDRALGLAATLLAACFLLCGMYAYLRLPTAATALLALLGLCFGLWLGGGPYFESYELRRLYGALTVPAIVFGFAFLVHFVLTLPEAGIRSLGPSRALVYGPAAATAAWILVLIVAEPPATSRLNTITNIVVSVFAGGYFLAALIALAARFRRASALERDAGLRVMAIGTFVGLVPLAVVWAIGAVAPKVLLPGVEFYFLTLLAVPIALAVGILGLERAGGLVEPSIARRPAAHQL